jgi:hypothetical protein
MQRLETGQFMSNCKPASILEVNILIDFSCSILTFLFDHWRMYNVHISSQPPISTKIYLLKLTPTRLQKRVLRFSQRAMFQVEFFWLLTLCCFVVGYQRFRYPCCLHFRMTWCVDLWNVGILPQHYITSQPRRPRLESSLDGGSMDLWNVGILPQQYTASQSRKPQRENLQKIQFTFYVFE